MRPPRVRLRTLMIAVAVVATLLGGTIEAMRLSRFADDCRRRAAHHARLMARWRSDFAEREEFWKGLSEEDKLLNVPRGRAHQQRVMEYEARLIEKYERAARYPWLPLPPDPPNPWRHPDYLRK